MMWSRRALGYKIENKGRYKFNGICPDCKNKVNEETQNGHANSNRQIWIDCPTCGYNGTGYTNKFKEKWIWSESRRIALRIGNEMDFLRSYAESIIWEINEMEGKHDCN